MKNIAVFLANGFEEIEAITPIDLLRRVNLDVTIIGVTGKTVTGANGVSIDTDFLLDEVNQSFDVVVIPGGMPGATNLSESEKVLSIIKEVSAQGGLVAAICAAPAVVLGKAGLLNNKKFTCYPGFEEGITEGTHLDDRVVVDGNLITSKGPGTANEFAFAILDYLIGERRSKALYEKTQQGF